MSLFLVALHHLVLCTHGISERLHQIPVYPNDTLTSHAIVKIKPVDPYHTPTENVWQETLLQNSGAQTGAKPNIQRTY
jgi:hypothetical protein